MAEGLRVATFYELTDILDEHPEGAVYSTIKKFIARTGP
jgi:hypothetical protein